MSIDQILRKFSFNATSRGGNAIRAQMRQHRLALRDIALVDRYTSRYGRKQLRSRKSNDGSRKSGSVDESISDDDGDMFSSSRSDSLAN